MLHDGAALTCSYEFTTERRGHLNVGPAFTSHGETVEATLEFDDGTHRRITVTFGSRVGEASFVVQVVTRFRGSHSPHCRQGAAGLTTNACPLRISVG
jgi:hypothetical protein